MAQNIILKRSSLPGKVPDTSSLNVGEVAINTYDGKLFIKRSGNIDSIQSVLTTDSVTTGSITLTQTASVAELVVTQDANIQRDLYVTNDIIGAGDIDITGDITGSSALLSGSLVVSGSTTITDNLTVLGAVNARQFNINVISSSVIYQSGSTKFGDTIDDTHEFTGSIDVSGSIVLNGIELGGSANSGSFTGSFTGSFIGDGSGLRGVVSDDLPVDGWDYQSNSSASISEFNTESRKYIIDFQWEEEVGTPIGFKTFISNVTGSSQIVPTEEGIKFIVGNQEVALVGPNGIQSVPPLGTVSGSSQLTSSYDMRYVLSGSITQTTWDNIASKPGGIVSGSSQISALGYATTSSLNELSTSVDIRLDLLETYSGSYTGSFSGSINARGQVDYLIFNSSSAATLQNYMLQANTTDKTLDLRMGNNATLQLGQEMYFPPIVNKSGVDLNDGDLVMVNPAGIAQGNRISVVKAISDGTYPADKIVGILTEDVANNAEGFATWFGYVRNISKTHIQPAGETWTEGDILYPNPAIPGKLTNVFPTAPNLKMTVATITSINGNNVTILVNFHKRTALKRAHDVLDNSTTSSYGDLLIKSGSVWTNKTPTQIGLATTGSNTFIGTQTLSGSIIPAIDNTYDLGSPTYQWRDIYVSSGSLYIDGTKVLGSTGNELQITTDVGQSIKILEAGSDSIILQSADGDIQLKTSGGGNLLFDPTTGLIDIRGTLQIQDGYKVTSSGGNAIQFGNDLGITGSINTTGNVNGINLTTFSSSVVTQISTIQTKTGSLATTGSNTFFGTQTFSGSVYIANDLVVQGSSSIQYISASSVSIGTNIVQLNTANPSVRYAGLSIIDSGSVGGSGSFLYDSVQDEFIFVHRGNGVNVTSSHFVLGPETYDDLGNETYLTNNRLSKGTGKEHLNDSNITDTGTLITLGSNTVVNGTFYATNTTLVSGSAQVVGILSSLNTYTGSNDTTNTTQNSRLDQLSTASGSAITRLTTIESVTGSYETKGRGIVSGSSQVDVMSTTNIARLATTGSNNFNGNQSITGSGYTVHNLRTLSSTNNSNYQLGNDSIANGAGMALFGSTWTTSGQYRQSGMYIYSNQAGGMTLNAEGANSMYLSTNGTTAITISSAQNTTFAGTITENSSLRYKENVETIHNGLDKVLQMRGVTYNKKDGGVKEVGVIAEEIYDILPEVVLKNEEGEIDSVSYGRIVGVLIEAIKDLKKEIEDLKANK